MDEQMHVDQAGRWFAAVSVKTRKAQLMPMICMLSTGYYGIHKGFRADFARTEALWYTIRARPLRGRYAPRSTLQPASPPDLMALLDRLAQRPHAPLPRSVIKHTRRSNQMRHAILRLHRARRSHSRRAEVGRPRGHTGSVADCLGGVAAGPNRLRAGLEVRGRSGRRVSAVVDQRQLLQECGVSVCESDGRDVGLRSAMKRYTASVTASHSPLNSPCGCRYPPIRGGTTSARSSASSPASPIHSAAQSFAQAHTCPPA